MKTTLALLFLSAAAAVTVGPSVQIKDLRLFYGEDEYFIKGIAYSPSPLAKRIEGQSYGEGLCTPRKTYKIGSFSETQTLSPCNYDDYFDGSVYPGGPTNGWFNDLWARDFPVMKQAGANTIRLYRTWPITQQSIDNNAEYTDKKSVVGVNHVPFFDAAQQYGFKVLFPLLADQDLIDYFDSDKIKFYIRAFVDEIGWHPALLMYSFGNELQFTSHDDNFIAKINQYIKYTREYQLQKWGRSVPITTALLDFVDSYSHLSSSLAVDTVMVNAGYRGFDFSGLWAQFRYLTCQFQKPVLIGEMGVHQDTKQFDTNDWFPTMWGDIVQHKNWGTIGGFLFEWSEEHWKGVSVDGDDWTKYPDVYMGAVSLTASSKGGFAVDDIHTKTDGAYSFDGIKQGFSQNVWQKDGPNKLSSVTNNLCTKPVQGRPAGACGTGTVSCGPACIDPNNKDYCCVAGYILQSSQCPPAAFLANQDGYFANSAGGAPETDQAIMDTSSQDPSVTKPNTANCAAPLKACGTNCYNENDYCCVNAQLTQKAFCPATSSTSSTTSTTSSSSSQDAGTPSTQKSSTSSQPAVSNQPADQPKDQQPVSRPSPNDAFRLVNSPWLYVVAALVILMGYF